jgi:hypothetical protein
MFKDSCSTHFSQLLVFNSHDIVSSFAVVSVVHFEVASNSQCKQISPFVDTLCSRYPSINFLKVWFFTLLPRCCQIAAIA